MNYYLSSYKFGSKVDALTEMIPANNKLGHINNTRDWVGSDPARAQKHQLEEIAALNKLGFDSESLDLREYFGKKNVLREKIESLGAIWVSGGNTFVLRQAMRLSGFDELMPEIRKRDEFLYGGYSAGVCVLSKDLTAIDQVDDPHNFPYEGIQKAIYEGLNVFEYVILPHYDSAHPESKMVEKEIQRCIDNQWLFIALRDGDVIVTNDQKLRM
ncbi:MAG: Type 1 glutamine amidotransferase-like domain-containing protein [Bacteroidota bacterium]